MIKVMLNKILLIMQIPTTIVKIKNISTKTQVKYLQRLTQVLHGKQIG